MNEEINNNINNDIYNDIYSDKYIVTINFLKIIDKLNVYLKEIEDEYKNKNNDKKFNNIFDNFIYEDKWKDIYKKIINLYIFIYFKNEISNNEINKLNISDKINYNQIKNLITHEDIKNYLYNYFIKINKIEYIKKYIELGFEEYEFEIKNIELIKNKFNNEIILEEKIINVYKTFDYHLYSLARLNKIKIISLFLILKIKNSIFDNIDIEKEIEKIKEKIIDFNIKDENIIYDLKKYEKDFIIFITKNKLKSLNLFTSRIPINMNEYKSSFRTKTYINNKYNIETDEFSIDYILFNNKNLSKDLISELYDFYLIRESKIKIDNNELKVFSDLNYFNNIKINDLKKILPKGFLRTITYDDYKKEKEDSIDFYNELFINTLIEKYKNNNIIIINENNNIDNINNNIKCIHIIFKNSNNKKNFPDNLFNNNYCTICGQYDESFLNNDNEEEKENYAFLEFNDNYKQYKEFIKVNSNFIRRIGTIFNLSILNSNNFDGLHSRNIITKNIIDIIKFFRLNEDRIKNFLINNKLDNDLNNNDFFIFTFNTNILSIESSNNIDLFLFKKQNNVFVLSYLFIFLLFNISVVDKKLKFKQLDKYFNLIKNKINLLNEKTTDDNIEKILYVIFVIILFKRYNFNDDDDKLPFEKRLEKYFPIILNTIIIYLNLFKANSKTNSICFTIYNLFKIRMKEKNIKEKLVSKNYLEFLNYGKRLIFIHPIKNKIRNKSIIKEKLKLELYDKINHLITIENKDKQIYSKNIKTNIKIKYTDIKINNNLNKVYYNSFENIIYDKIFLDNFFKDINSNSNKLFNSFIFDKEIIKIIFEKDSINLFNINKSYKIILIKNSLISESTKFINPTINFSFLGNLFFNNSKMNEETFFRFIKNVFIESLSLSMRKETKKIILKIFNDLNNVNYIDFIKLSVKYNFESNIKIENNNINNNIIINSQLLNNYKYFIIVLFYFYYIIFNNDNLLIKENFINKLLELEKKVFNERYFYVDRS